MAEKGDTAAGDPKVFFDPDPGAELSIDIVILGDCVGVKIGSLSLIFRGYKSGEGD